MDGLTVRSSCCLSPSSKRRIDVPCIAGQVMAEMGLPFDRKTLSGVSMHYRSFLYGYEQVRLQLGCCPSTHGDKR